LAAVAASAATQAAAQSGYPAGLTVKFIVGFPAGGAQDIVGRLIADRLGALWKVPTVVEYVAGAGGNLGIDRVAKGPSHGSQICIVPPGIATNQYPYPRVPEEA
jgi:tripartite-type tricarboxylate transporter receptor subunit TctC